MLTPMAIGNATKAKAAMEGKQKSMCHSGKDAEDDAHLIIAQQQWLGVASASSAINPMSNMHRPVALMESSALNVWQ